MKTHSKKPVDVAASPVFVATFTDGQVTRMSTNHAPDRASFDLARGLELSRSAYRSRMKRSPPAIIEARFETPDSTVLQT